MEALLKLKAESVLLRNTDCSGVWSYDRVRRLTLHSNSFIIIVYLHV